MLVTGEDTRWHRLSAGCCFRKFISSLIEAPWDVIKLEDVELVLQPMDLSAVCDHLSIVAARLLHDLVNNQLGVSSNV